MTKWLAPEELAAWRALQTMQLRLHARLARDLAEHSSLGYQDYIVLVALTDQRGDRARVNELAHWLGWEKSRLSHQVSRMVARGLVTKRACDSDRRGSFVEATARGRHEIEAAAPSHVDAVRRLFVGRLDAAQLEQLTIMCSAVVAAVDEEEADECHAEEALSGDGC